MAANSQSQHRCVFVGNIPYDATEEQLVQICEEVGPVVSFRLVLDRETGKPKGYGFCEYKDGETAASARRNLQGYEINGRQLRVDFAENDKNADRNREQGRGGPGVAANVDAQKQIGGPAVLGHPSLHQPIGDSAAIAAATVMAGALGSSQTATSSNEIGLQNQSLLGTDPLTRHLAKMSKSQLTEVVSELKAIATQNKEQARQLLLAFPNLPKALFQAQIMLGLVSPQMLQMPNIRQAFVQPLVQNVQALPGLPPLPQNKTQSSVQPYAQESRVSSSVSDQYAVQPVLQNFSTQVQIQRLQLTQNQVIQQGPLLPQLGVPPHPSIHPQSLSGLSVGQVHTPTSSSFNQQMQHPLSQNATPVPPTNSGHSDRRMSPNVNVHASKLIHPQYSVAGLQLSSSTSPGMPETMDLKRHALTVSDQMDRSSKMVKLNDGKVNPSPIATPLSAPFPTSDIGRQASRTGATISPEKQATQVQLPADVDSTLLEQVLNLTPEQLRSLPPDQQQQVIQLQQMLRQGT